MTKQEIISGMLSWHWSREDLDEFRQVLKSCRDTVNAVAKWEFKSGDRVRFVGRRGEVVTGTVERRMTKNILVRADDRVGWRVSPSVLEKI